MKQRILLLALFFSIGCYAEGGVLWHCTATNDKGAVWNQYSETHQQTRQAVERLCSPFNNRKPCEMVCFPPRTYWRCMARDTVPPQTHSEKNNVVVKPGTWYWTSFSKQIAMNGARDACRHNSEYGGCYVDPNACASSQEE